MEQVYYDEDFQASLHELKVFVVLHEPPKASSKTTLEFFWTVLFFCFRNSPPLWTRTWSTEIVSDSWSSWPWWRRGSLSRSWRSSPGVPRKWKKSKRSRNSSEQVSSFAGETSCSWMIHLWRSAFSQDMFSEQNLFSSFSKIKIKILLTWFFFANHLLQARSWRFDASPEGVHGLELGNSGCVSAEAAGTKVVGRS